MSSLFTGDVAALLIALAMATSLARGATLPDPGALPDEQAVVTGLGMAYQHIPVDWDHPPRAARWKRSGRIIPAMSCPRSRNGSSSSPTVWQAAALECAARPIHDEIGA